MIKSPKLIKNYYRGGYMGTLILFTQFSYKSKTSLQNKVYITLSETNYLHMTIVVITLRKLKPPQLANGWF